MELALVVGSGVVVVPHEQEIDEMKRARKSKKIRGGKDNRATAVAAPKQSDKVERALQAMPVGLRKKYNIIHDILGKSSAAGASAKHEVGVQVVEVMDDEKKYGKQAVETLGRALGRNADSLYDYGKVARTWNRQTFNELLRQRSVYRAPLTFSHFIVLAEAPKAIREGLRREALKKGLTVRALRARAEGRSPRSQTTDGRVYVLELSASCEATGKRLAALAKSVNERVGEAEPSPELAEALDTMSAKATELQASLDKVKTAIDMQRHRVREAHGVATAGKMADRSEVRS